VTVTIEAAASPAARRQPAVRLNGKNLRSGYQKSLSSAVGAALLPARALASESGRASRRRGKKSWQ
jgi:hypothetical protein